VTPYYDHAGITIYQGDCLDVLHHLPEQIATIVGDPPYCSGGRQQAASRLVLEKAAADRRSSWFLTDNMGTDSWLWWMREIAGRLFMLGEIGAHFYCFTDWRQYTNLVMACETKGWTLRNVVVWDKARGGAMGSFWRNNHEWVPVFSKGPARAIAHGGFFNTWQGAKPQADEHATVKPAGLVSYLLEAAGPGLVLDPWMGSGTTLFAAKALGRRAIGIEIEEKYCEIAAKRLGQEVLPFASAGTGELK
jgi:site-specific DNA-methyltransferase (adenine-specific)